MPGRYSGYAWISHGRLGAGPGERGKQLAAIYCATLASLSSAAGDLKGKDGGDLPTQESNEFPFNVFPSPGLCFPILIWPLA